MKAFNELGYRGQVRRLARMAQAALVDFSITVSRLIPMAHRENTTFRVDTPAGERFVLRITQPEHHTVAAVRSEMIWLDALNRTTDVIVPQPMSTRKGESLTSIQVDGVPEPRICTLFHWVDGRFVNRGLTPSHLDRVGVLTAQLHNYSAHFITPPGFVRRQVDGLTYFAQPQADNYSPASVAHAMQLVAAIRPPEDVAVVEAALARVLETMRELGRRPEMYGLIHGDLHQWNYLFHKGRVRAIDFDDCGYGLFIYDLCVTLSEIRDKENYPALRAALLAGYRSIRPLPAAHEAHLDTLITLRALQDIFAFIELRDHPASRANWQVYVDDNLQRLRKFIGA
jgi:Ser/Thr protein kinase RdoA (MazF antagonist)